MASLYEIDNAIMECIDPETGEIIDAERLTALQMERDKKIEGVACWVKNLDADAAAYKAEKDAFAARQAKAEKLADGSHGRRKDEPAPCCNQLPRIGARRNPGRRSRPEEVSGEENHLHAGQEDNQGNPEVRQGGQGLHPRRLQEYPD